MPNSKQKDRGSKSVTKNQTAKRKSFNQGKARYKSNKSHMLSKTQWQRKEPEDEARKQKFKEREELRAQKITEDLAEKERVQREKQERVRSYKKKRLEKTKAISKKTQRGQPLMKDRMQLLLKQIQEMKRNGY